MSVLSSQSPKSAHYNQALTSALLSGAWSDSKPGSTPNGTELTWAELVRKWGKHTGGNTTLVNHLRDISLLYLSSASHSSSSGHVTANSSLPPAQSLSVPDTNGSPQSSADAASNRTAASHSSSFIHVPLPGRRPKTSLDGTVSQIIPSTSGSTIRPQNVTRAAYLSTRDLDGDDDGATEAWAEGSKWWRGVALEEVDDARDGMKSVEGLMASGTLKLEETQSARLTHLYHLHALGLHTEVIRLGRQMDWENPQTGSVEGDASVLERLRARTLFGMSAELIPEPDYDLAFESYLSVIPLLKLFKQYNPPFPTYLSTPKTQNTALPFDRYREVFRFISTALTRAAIITSRANRPIINILRIVRTYHALSSSWPPAFRPVQRQRMLLLYLRALHAGYPPSGASPLPARMVWRKEVIEAMRTGRQLLATTTTFPRAGSVNAPVTAFTDLCVALYDTCPLLVKEVLGVLWWSMTYTFQSQSVLRHLTRLLAASGDATDARRTFELYVGLVLKSRQTAQPEVSLQLKRRPTEDMPASPSDIALQAGQAADGDGPMSEERKNQTAEAESDGDEDFVEALLVGARVLLKDLGDAEEAWRYVNLAGDVVINGDKQGQGCRGNLKAEVEECKGIVRMAMAMQAQAINHLTAATSLNPKSASVFYHLAYCQAESRSINSATESVGQALELDPRNLQAWHLLALLLTAAADWSGAMKACEAGVTVWEDDEASSNQDDLLDPTGPPGNPDDGDPMIESKDFAVTPAVSSPLTSSSAILLSTSGTLRPPDRRFKPPVPRWKKLDNVIRLRMTLNIIVEKMQGPEVAMLKHQELFAFFSLRSGRHRQNFGYQRNGLQNVNSATSVRDLGGSYVSIKFPTQPSTLVSSPTSAQYPVVEGPGVAVIPPSPADEDQGRLSNEVGEAPALMVSSAHTSPGDSTTNSENDADEGGTLRIGEKKSGRKSFTGVEPTFLTYSLITFEWLLLATSGADRPDTDIQRSRISSVSSIALSLAPTAVHSHYRNRPSPSRPSPPPLPSSNPAQSDNLTPLESRVLSNLWLMSASTFRRWGKSEQALVSIQEAESLDPENPDVWVQLGTHHVVLNNFEAALPAYTKSILLRPDHPAGIVVLAKLYLSTGQVDLAHTLLNQLTQDTGWDVPEAWFYLGKVCEAQGRMGRSKECLVYALGLEESRPCRRWRDSVDRWL
ncbi:hypothetical protein TREMEDRAFT_44986 [Tremella mesenterica DSM 1558]|uniref:uncharacterized protein n=1 Tax=Tremella mesenterica (strain ATCC 24925 / CBS 8224 / DSM 1558 / NBRC 9311 / NRRL Y-6157 / RJB 2259-6 / UBC 559-6) TaxID=578456 RepID=UPI0003F492D5|nr:uncharacterized protein TREMEDRAFT_44986 [Tremella mesenterica DSM 1558]EIW68009.1 hypothetical protein TREMEDRAFT_44986 [Tremella mesenterica DSM 1558]